MNIALLIVIAYVLILYGVSWYANKLSKDDEGAIGYLLAGRGLPSYIVGVMVAGLAVGGASTVGVAERAYTQGISAGMYNAAWAAGAIVVGVVAAGRFRNLNITTIPELFGKYYGELGKVFAVVGQLIIQIVITSLQYVAGGAILTALLPRYFSFSTGMMVTAIVFVGIALIGGYWAAGLSNLINVIVIYLGIIIGVVMGISEGGGVSHIVSTLPSGSHWFNPITGVGFGIIAAWFVVMITQAHSTQAIVQISFAASDDEAASKGFILGGLLILPVGFMSALFGIIAAAQFPGLEEAAMALPKVVLNLNVAVGGLTLAALWAADVSTAVGLLLGSSTLVVNDSWKPYIQSDMTEKQELFMSRAVVLGISIVTYILAMTVVGILKTLLIGLTLTTAYTVILLFTLFAPKLCKKSSAAWTLGVGTVCLALWVFVPQIHIVSHPIFLEWPVCLVTFLLVSVFDQRPANISDEVVESEAGSTA